MHSYNENGKKQLMDYYNFKIASDRVNSKNKMNEDSFNSERSQKVKNQNPIDLPIFQLKAENSLSSIQKKVKSD